MSEFKFFVDKNLEEFKNNFIKYPGDPKIIQALQAKLEEYNGRTEEDYKYRAPENSWHHFAKVFVLRALLNTKADVNELDVYTRFKSEVGEKLFDFTEDGSELIFMDKFDKYFDIIKTYAEKAGKGLWGGTGLDIG